MSRKPDPYDYLDCCANENYDFVDMCRPKAKRKCSLRNDVAFVLFLIVVGFMIGFFL